MTGNSDGLTTSVGQYAFDRYSRHGGGGLLGLFTRGLADLSAATKALAAANEAHALAVDPHAVDTMIKKLTDMQDELANLQRRSNKLATRTPLGGGYAEEVGSVNGQLGHQVVGEIIPEMVNAIDALKEQVEKSRASYRNVEEANTGTYNNLDRNLKS
ncbi:hypothetical protein ACQPW3_10650 [Actinosynnema sp. CA-248983]